MEDNSQAADKGQRTPLNWQKGYDRIATVLSVLWCLFVLSKWLNLTLMIGFSPSSSSKYFAVMCIGLFILWVIPPSLVYLINWFIKGFTDKPEK